MSAGTKIAWSLYGDSIESQKYIDYKMKTLSLLVLKHFLDLKSMVDSAHAQILAVLVEPGLYLTVTLDSLSQQAPVA